MRSDAATVDEYLESLPDDRREALGAVRRVGKSCVRFKRVDDLPLDLIGATIEATSVGDSIALVSQRWGEE